MVQTRATKMGAFAEPTAASTSQAAATARTPVSKPKAATRTPSKAAQAADKAPKNGRGVLLNSNAATGCETAEETSERELDESDEDCDDKQKVEPEAQPEFDIVTTGNKDSDMRMPRIAPSEIATGVAHKVPADLRDALIAQPTVRTAWNSLTPLARNEWICWITSVKKLETRSKHIVRACTDLTAGKRRPCCWPGCAHR